MSETSRRLATIMFSDMVGYSSLAERDEAMAIELLNEHRAILRQLFTLNGGRENDAVGDGFFVEFPSAVDAVRCAVAIQKVLKERNDKETLDRRIDVRIGLHVGDVVVQEGSVLGDGVNIAARIQQQASAGGICLSEDVARLVQNKIDLPLEDLGRKAVKNISQPVHIYRLVLPWEKSVSLVSRKALFERTRKSLPRVVVVVAIFVVALAGAHVWKKRSDIGVTLNNRIAVLPFVSLSSDSSDEYFSDGITDEMISRLSRVRGLEVIARTSAMSYKGTRKTVADIGRELNVGTVLEGSVRRDGRKVRISAQLVRTTNESPPWGENYDLQLDQVLVAQKSIADRVASALAPVLGSASAATYSPRSPQNADAYTAYLRGRFEVHKSSLHGILEGIKYYEEAIRLDPIFALAYVGLAEAYEQLPMQDDVYSNEAYSKARGAATRAIELDSSIAEAYAALGVVKAFHDYYWEGSEAEFKRALELNPNSSSTHWWYAWYLFYLRRFDEGVKSMERAVELDPVSIAKNTDLGWAYTFPRRADDAIAQLKKTLNFDPTNVQVLSALGWAYMSKGAFKEAEEAFLEELSLAGRVPFLLVDLAFCYGYQGDVERAKQVLDEVKAASKSQPVSAWAWSIGYLPLALRDEKYREVFFRWMNETAEAHSFWQVYTGNFYYAPLHADPRWVAYRKLLRLPP